MNGWVLPLYKFTRFLRPNWQVTLAAGWLHPSWPLRPTTRHIWLTWLVQTHLFSCQLKVFDGWRLPGCFYIELQRFQMRWGTLFWREIDIFGWTTIGKLQTFVLAFNRIGSLIICWTSHAPLALIDIQTCWNILLVILYLLRNDRCSYLVG